ncbi:STAS domain-containing protein [Sporomusa sphaeroides]|uniref:Anti-sigma factor antagonist n=1 Tax=Sporomusa sphaeroides DSM 2875 TaxID=1337886 RepID=A0A1U7M9X8_9FIRM|nr:STAS domain-containing protein [Sporomusa sphaeroides]OLS54360.1 anti-sigma-B factor antagonist [Sporomusa sphaeroides DSM 2875]CVK21656.1 Anti-sigma-B factor antagonist [Sporomusa sphaeroides DSM 2875]
MFNFIKSEDDKAVKVTVYGEIEGSKRRTFNDEFGKLLNDNIIHFQFDMSQVTYIDSTGIGIFLDLRKKALNRGGSVYVYNMPDHIQMLFRVTHLEKLFCIKPNLGGIERA